MNEPINRQELRERLSLIEAMISEGRQTTASWGWAFLLWGAAYSIAIAWSSLGYAAIAWPITMSATGVLTGIIASRKVRHLPITTTGRAIRSIWVALGISCFFIGLAAAFAHQHGERDAIATISVLLGMANGASSLTLRWKLQFACALLWWAAAVISLLGTLMESRIAFVATMFLCNIVFGLYLMISDLRGNRPTEPAMNHA